ncbi:hypothetical protein KCU92_g66, partial [Aureobasidium melanogenum]
MFIYLAAVLIRSGMLTWSNIMKLDHINELDHINNRVDYLVTCTILRCRLCKSGSQSFHIVSDVMVTTPVAEHDHFYQPLMKLLDSLSPPTIFELLPTEDNGARHRAVIWLLSSVGAKFLHSAYRW